MMEQVKILREVENLKLQLGHTTDFTLPDCFKMFSINRVPKLAKHEFLKGCQLFGIITRNKEKLIYVYERF